MLKYRMAFASAFLNLFGSILVFFSFQATSTNLLLVAPKDGSFAFCIGDRAVFGLGPGGSTIFGYKCPEALATKPAAVVNTDSPGLAKFGWLLIGFGFLFQTFSIQKPPSSTEPLPALRSTKINPHTGLPHSKQQSKPSLTSPDIL
jgi:hypothetical protein